MRVRERGTTGMAERKLDITFSYTAGGPELVVLVKELLRTAAVAEIPEVPGTGR